MSVRSFSERRLYEAQDAAKQAWASASARRGSEGGSRPTNAQLRRIKNVASAPMRRRERQVRDVGSFNENGNMRGNQDARAREEFLAEEKQDARSSRRVSGDVGEKAAVERVMVCVRVRPVLTREKIAQAVRCVRVLQPSGGSSFPKSPV